MNTIQEEQNRKLGGHIALSLSSRVAEFGASNAMQVLGGTPAAARAPRLSASMEVKAFRRSRRK